MTIPQFLMRHNTATKYWEQCKEYLQSRIPASLYQSLIDPIQVKLSVPSQENKTENKIENNIALFAPNKKTAARISQRYLPMIERFFANTPLQGQVSILVLKKENTAAEALSLTEKTAAEKINPEASLSLAEKKSASCIEDCSAAAGENFCIPKINLSQIKGLWQESNPIYYIYGAEGSGKSTVGSAFIQHKENLGKRARLLKFGVFLSELAVAARNRDSVNWRKRLRAYECLIIDDFHYIKPQALRSQEELLYLIDEFHQQNKCLIFCAAQPAADLRLTPPLLSRLQAARSISLAYPNQQERAKVLEKESIRCGLNLKKDAITYLSRRISKDMRRLKSAVRRIAEVYPCLGTEKLSTEKKGMAVQLEISLFDRECLDLYTKTTEMTPQAVLEVVAQFYKVPLESIVGPARDKKYSLARHAAAYLCKNYLKMNLKESAEVIGRRNHVSTLHACKKIERLMKEDLFFRRQIQDLFLQIQP